MRFLPFVLMSTLVSLPFLPLRENVYPLMWTEHLDLFLSFPGPTLFFQKRVCWEREREREAEGAVLVYEA